MARPCDTGRRGERKYRRRLRAKRCVGSFHQPGLEAFADGERRASKEVNITVGEEVIDLTLLRCLREYARHLSSLLSTRQPS